MLRVFKKITLKKKNPTRKKMDGWYGVLYENRTKPKRELSHAMNSTLEFAFLKFLSMDLE